MPVQQLRVPSLTPQGPRAALPDKLLPGRAVAAAGLTGAGGLKWLGIFLQDIFSGCTCTKALLSKPLSFFLLEEERFRDLDRKFTGCTRRKSVRKEEIQPFIHIHKGCSKAAPGCHCCFAVFSEQSQLWPCSEHTTPHLGSFEAHSLGEGRHVLCHIFIHNIQGQRLPDLLDGTPAQLGNAGTPGSA